MPFESKESIRRVHSIVDQISASVSLRESQSANLNLENNSLILLKWKQKPSSKSFESTRRRFNGLHMNWETRIRNPLRVWVGVRDQFRRQPSCKIFASGHKKKPHHPIGIASLEKSESVLFKKQRLQTPISAISGLQA